jgi:hypothetical protein
MAVQDEGLVVAVLASRERRFQESSIFMLESAFFVDWV